jgi:hypothetical protein
LWLFQGYKAGVQLKRVWQKQDKQDNLEQDKEDKTTWNKTKKTKEDKRRQTIQYKKDKKDNLKQDKDELELGTWMLQLHAKGDGNSVRACSCDICSVVGFYAMLCKVYSKIKMCGYKFLNGKRCMEEALPNSEY